MIRINRRKREPQAAVMGWQCLSASCNRAISKKLQALMRTHFSRALKVRESNEEKHKKKRDALARNDVHWAGQSFIPNQFF